MNMQDFYDEMKEALRYFGLRFAEMDQVELIFRGDTNEVVFTYGTRQLTFKLND